MSFVHPVSGLCTAILIMASLGIAPAFASSGGIDTSHGIHNLPIAVEGTPIIELDDSTNPATVEIEGDVGIGTPTPQSKLDVNGAITPGSSTAGSSCGSVGAIAHDSTGAPLFCISGTWTSIHTTPQAQQLTCTIGSGGNCTTPSCPTGYVLTGCSIGGYGQPSAYTSAGPSSAGASSCSCNNYSAGGPQTCTAFCVN